MTEPLAPTTIGERQAIAEGENWTRCPSTHCERAQECRSPNDCSGTGRHKYGVSEWTDSSASSAVGGGHASAGANAPTTKAPVADREAVLEEAAKIADYQAELSQDNLNENYDPAFNRPALKMAKRIASNIRALRQTLPIHGEMREALERIAGSWTQFNDEPGNALASGYKTQRDMMQQIARNALQGDGL